jgi:hypothetical protein
VPAALYHQIDAGYSFLLEVEVIPGPQRGARRIRSIENLMTLLGIEPTTFWLVE